MKLEVFAKSLKAFLAVSCVALAVGCADATRQNSKAMENGDFADADPYEGLNRGLFELNRAIDTVALRPIAKGYEAVVPNRGKVMVSHFVDNVNEPVTFVNSILQADPQNSFASLWRFLINSSFGIGGLFDAATEIGLTDRPTGFGDTLAIYGADSGPYFVIPIIGPSTTRDSFGRLGDVLADPFSYTDNAVFYTIVGVKTVNTRYHKLKLLDDVYANSLDPYATIRSGYLQHREAEVKKAKALRKKSQEKAFNENAKNESAK